MPRLGGIPRLVLAALLLAAWQVALLHPLEHVDAAGGFVHVPGTHVPKMPGDKGGSNPLCAAIAGLAACVAGTAEIHVAAVNAVDVVVARKMAPPPRAAAPAYLSQAPPFLL